MYVSVNTIQIKMP